MNDTPVRYLQIYTGNGKGKTTAAIGQSIRAAGSRLRTLFVMFMKDFPYGEVRALESLSEFITIERYGGDQFVYERQLPPPHEVATARRALARARDAMRERAFDIVVLDEICVAVYFKLLTEEDVLAVIDERPPEVELILTGRYCPQSWLDRADLVTEMTEIKHYYTNQGVLSRKGFES